MRNKLVLQRILTGLFVVLVLAASNSIVRAQGSPPSTNWIASRGDWFNCNNWSGVCPNPLVDAHINNGGQAQIQGGPNHAAAYSLTLGDSQGDSGSLVIDTDHSAVLDLSGECRGNIYIGYGGSGTLTIKDDGYIRSRYGYVAALQNSSGNVTVQGNHTTWYLYDVYDDPECLGAGLFIGATANSNSGGTATVNVSDGAFISVHNHDQGAAYAVKVGVSGTLTGNATLEMVGPTGGSITAKVYGTLAPGKSLTIDGNLDLTSPTNSANTVCHVNPQATPQPNDKVYVTSTTGGGTALLGGRLTVVGSGTFTAGMSFTLLHAETQRIGTFFSWSFISKSGLGSCLKATLEYTAQDVILHIVNTCAEELPEP